MFFLPYEGNIFSLSGRKKIQVGEKKCRNVRIFAAE